MLEEFGDEGLDIKIRDEFVAAARSSPIITVDSSQMMAVRRIRTSAHLGENKRPEHEVIVRIYSMGLRRHVDTRREYY